jgi:opacity protein-like surface antigen
MKKLALAAVIALVPTGAALAATVAELDADANGTLSMAELQAAYPSLSAEGFTAVDANGDGAVDDAEFTAAVDAGTLVTGG